MVPSQPVLPTILPLFPLQDQVVFPHTVFPLYISAGQMALLDEAMRCESMVGLFVEIPGNSRDSDKKLSEIGTACRINQVFRFPEGGSKIVVEGVGRIRVRQMLQRQPCLLAQIEGLEEHEVFGPVTEAMVQSVNALLKIALAYGRPLPGDVVKMLDQIGEAGRLADLVSVYLNLDPAKQQHLLEILDPLERLKEVYLLLAEEVQRLQVRGQVQNDVTKRLGRVQKEYLLREQMKEIQQELGDGDPRQTEINELRKRIKERGLPDSVKKVADKELARLERINPASPEYTVARTYLDYLTNMPWAQGTPDELDLNQAEKILDEDHHDLKPAKERILEYLAVRSLKETVKGPILCFVGPPGVGKTSLGRSIARAMGRKFIRVSLGGMKDEAEIRGHRRTYIGALPGRIIQEICRCEANNPVFMLDEVDKVGQDFRGDPAAALLEVLDPEQNHSFNDHYLDVPFDLSRVMFIATANLLDPIPHALKDRMEVIQLSGYGDEDKIQIAFQFLIPKQQEENGLADYQLHFEEEAVQQMIRGYTREAGVRGLERQIASICRKLARAIAQKRTYQLLITPQEVEHLLGPRKFFTDVSAEEDRVGVVTGLAWTESGGDIIFIEAAAMPGSQQLILTGSLGNVMQESAKAALSFVRGHAREFGFSEESLARLDIHVHVPAGAIPKDGPSAGITLATALISLLSGRPARREVAMTGELTLSGRILPIGGVKEKILAARRAGVRTVLLPEHNREHLQELDGVILEDMSLILVEDMHQVVEHCLLPKPAASDAQSIDSQAATLLGPAT